MPPNFDEPILDPQDLVGGEIPQGDTGSILNLRLGSRLGNILNNQQTERLFQFIRDLKANNQLPKNILGGRRGRIGLQDLQRLFDANVGEREFLAGILGIDLNPPAPTEGPPPPGSGGDGGGPGGTGGPGGFTARGQHIPAPFTTPQSGAINSLFEKLLAGEQRQPRDIDVLDPGLREEMMAAISGLLGTTRDDLLPADDLALVRGILEELSGSPGLPADALRSAQNRVREGLATRERELLTRRGEDFAARNAFGSGPQVRALEDIERGVSQELANRLTEISLADAAAAERARSQALTGGLGLGQLLLAGGQAAAGIQGTGLNAGLGLGRFDLAQESTAIQEALARQGLDLDALRLAISRELGLGNLDLGQSELELQRQLQDFLQNLFLQANAFGIGGEETNPLADLGFNFNFEFPGFERPRF